ncbi:hypothetical protein [Geodermatophilus ruber]|uniref:PRC-barrel domain-containing protein n=1 Tax=Geodermatophilus ruber TaxID=504800 RepID=A0A1I4CXV5_9ACTN|nr:hypothetical protein [Geodermatophilus ruber]SFK84816.1 hypothetical protein SAMN04488085_10422 [Geodermatophilus ruber]
MGLPGRDEASTWVGRTVVDRAGTGVGTCTAVLADEATGLPEWMCVDVDGVNAVVPVIDAAAAGDRVRVAVSRSDVTGAPLVGGPHRLSEAQEIDLYRHYGIGYSREASGSLLPTSAAEFPPGADEAAPRGRRAAVVTGALAGVAAMAAAAVRARRMRARPPARQSWLRLVWARRPWVSRPPTPAERIARGVQAVSVGARAGAWRLAASATSLAASGLAAVAAELARRGIRPGTH